MTLILESGAINDISEIAAGLPAEEEARIQSCSLEELFTELDDLVTERTELPDELVEELNVVPGMESLMAVITSIRDSGSISRCDAQSLKTMTASMEGFETLFDTMPIKSFTEMPSKVNFQPAMEGFIGNVIKTIVEAIKKIIAWIRDKVKNITQFLKRRPADLAKIEKASKQAVADYKPLTPEAIGKAVDGVSKISFTLQSRIEQVRKENPDASAPELTAKVVELSNQAMGKDLNDYMITFGKDYFGKYDPVSMMNLLAGIVAKPSNAATLNQIAAAVADIYKVIVGKEGGLGDIGDADDPSKLDVVAGHVREYLTEIQRYLTGLTQSRELVNGDDWLRDYGTVINGLKKFDHGHFKKLNLGLIGAFNDRDNESKKIERELNSVLSSGDEEAARTLKSQAIINQLKFSVCNFMQTAAGLQSYQMARMAKIVHLATAA